MSIQELLSSDQQNAEITRKNLGLFSPELPEALEEAASLYTTVSRAFGQRASDDQDAEAVMAWAEAMDLKSLEDVRASLEDGTKIPEEFAQLADEARDARVSGFHNQWNEK